MLFLLRPRQTWMPYARPRDRAQQASYNRQLQDAYSATRRVPPSAPEIAGRRDPYADVEQLGRLHDAGVLTDAEFATAKARLLDAGTGAT